MSNFITFIKYQKEKNTKQNKESNLSTLYLLDDSFQFNILEYMPKDFTISTNNGSYKFNIDILINTSSVIADLNQSNPQDLQYHLNINDEHNILAKFQQMYQGKIINFERSDLDVAYKIVDLLNINCISLDDSSFQISNESLINFLDHAPLETFTIHTNKKSYKCNIFGIYSSEIIRDYLSKNPTKKEFKFDYEDENAEFQLICDIFNFEKVTINADNMKFLKKISDHLCIENISEKINRFCQKYEKLYERIDKHQKTIDSIDTLFNLLCQIKEKTVKFVSDSIIHSIWVKTEENIQELAAFIIQVSNTDISMQPYLIDLVIQLDKESNETNNLKKLIPFIVKKSKIVNFLPKLRSVFKCSFLYYLSKKGIISKEELLTELRYFFRVLNTNKLYSNPYQNYDDDDRNHDFDEKKFYSNFVHSIYIWFLPEIVEINHFDASHIKSEKVNKFISSFYPDNLDQYKRIRDNVEPNDALTKALRNDDIDTLQLILLNGINPKSNPVVPFNMFEFFVPNGETNYLNYSAAYGSIKCFKHLLSNHFECDLSTFSFAVLGGNKEIIKIVDEKSSELNSLPKKYSDDQNYTICLCYPVNESRNRESNFYKIAPSIVKHQNDVFDWILNEKFSSDELNDEFIYQLLGISIYTGNIHSFIEVIRKNLILPNDFVNGMLFSLCLQGFYQFAKIFYILLNKDNDYQYNFNELSSVFFGNLSIFKLCLNGIKTDKMLFSAFNLAIKYFNQNIIEYYFDKLVNEGLNFNMETINKSLEIAIKEPSGEIFLYLFNKFKELLKSKIPFNTDILKMVCVNNNLKIAKLLFESYFSSKKFEEKDVTDWFIIAANNGSLDICKYLIENQYIINFSELSKSYNKFTSIDEKIFSLIIDNCDPFIKQQFLYFYFEPSIKNKKYDFVEFLLKQNIITDSAIFIAIENEDLQMIELILNYKNNPSFSINKKYQDSTALCKAVKSKNIEIIKTLLSVPTIDPNLCDSELQTPLMIAFPNIEIMDIILDFIGDDIVHQTRQLLFLKMQTYIMFDLDKEKATRLLEIILKIKGIEINSDDNNFLIYACRDNNMKVFNMLINLDNIDLNICDSFNNTPLTTAISNNNTNIAELLIKDQRTDINKNTKDNESPLSLAISKDQEKIVDLLLNHDKFDPVESHLDAVFTSSSFKDQLKILNSKHFDVNHMLICDNTSKFYSYPFDDFENVLKYAVCKNDQQLIDSIIQHPEFDKTKSFVESIIFQTIDENNKFETFKKLLNLLTNEVNDYKYQNISLFDYSFSKWNIRSLKEIINHPCFDFKKNNIQDCFYSCFDRINEHSIELMKFLYEFDAKHDKIIDLNQLTKSGETVFTLINNANYGEINEVVSFLLENGADPNLPNKEGKYPLQHAIQIQSFEFVHELLKTEKVDVTKRIKSMNNATYLHLAALVRETSIFIEILNLNKIDINAIDDNGETPLIYIARFGRPKNLKPLFLSEKLDYLHCNNQNKNALQIAIGNNTDHLTQLNESQLKDKYVFCQKLIDEIGNNNFDNLKNAQNYIPYLYDNENEIEAKITQLPTGENENTKNISEFVDNSSIFNSDDDFESKNHSDASKSSEKIIKVKSVDKEQIKPESLPKLHVKQNSEDHHFNETNKSPIEKENEKANQEKLPKLNPNKSSNDHHGSESQENATNNSTTNEDKNENLEFSKQNNADESKQNINEADKNDQMNEVFQIKEPSTPNSNNEKTSIKTSEMNSSPRSLHNQIKTLQNKAEKGDAESQYSLGIRYSKGKGVPIDKEKAFSLYLSAAELGNMNAQYSAAACYSYGKGTEINKEKAFEFYLKSAEQGFDKAQFAVAHFYQYGLGGVEKNHDKAIEWYKKAANQGHKGSIDALDL